MVFLVIPVMFLAIVPNFFEPVNIFRSLLLPIWLLVYLLIKPKGKPNYLKLTAILSLVPIGYLISAIENKQNPILALVGLSNRNMGILTFLSMTLILYVFSRDNLKPESFLKFGLRPLVYLSCIIGLRQIMGLDPVFSKPDDDRIVLFYGNSNFAASSLAITLLVPLFDFFQARKKNQKIINFALFVFILFLGYKTQAVQFYVLSFASIAVFIITNFYVKLKIIIKQQKFLFSVLIFFGVLIGFLLKNYNRLSELANIEDRLFSWKIGFDMFSDHLIFGVGVENFSRYQGIYKSYKQQRDNGEWWVIDKAHNVFIDHFANGGLITGLSFLFFIIASLIFLVKINFSALSPINRMYFSLFSTVWVVYVFHLTFSTDNILQMTISFSCLAMISQIASSTNIKFLQGGSHKLHKDEFFIRSTVALALVPLVLVSYRAIDYEIKVPKVLTNQILNGNEIISLVKGYPNPSATEAIIVHSIGLLDNCPFVIDASDELLKLDSRSAQAWYFKSICAENVGDFQNGLDFVNKALETQPIVFSYLAVKYKFEARLGKSSDANRTFERIKQIFPDSPRLSELNGFLQGSTSK